MIKILITKQQLKTMKNRYGYPIWLSFAPKAGAASSIQAASALLHTKSPSNEMHRIRIIKGSLS